MNSQGQHIERTAFRKKLEAIRAASKKYMRTREALFAFPGMHAFARLVDAAIELHNAIDPEEKESLGTRIVYGLLRLALTIVGDITMFWKRRIRG
jgi:hypothetical protein